jgi:2,5-diamino-6-(ribosylamino)-4(3H)-pyrimidinone 5'-phosphate reductase
MKAKVNSSTAKSGGSSRPFVFINMAMTADGKSASANRAISSFSSKRDIEHLYELRATADAVMSGARTIDLNAVKLGPGGQRYRRLRLKNGLAEYNLRIIVSGSGSIDPGAEIFRHHFSPIIILTTHRASQRKLATLRKLADEVRISGDKEIHWRSALRWLRRKWHVRRLLCEGGGELSGALFAASVVAELHLTICPKVIGGRNAPTIADGSVRPALSSASQMQLKDKRLIGSECFLTFSVV